MRFFVDKQNKVPLYLQLTDEIRYYISTGVLTENEQLPPIKVLAKELGINFLTVRKAYKELEKECFVAVRHGEGTFISLTGTGSRERSNPAGTNGDETADAHSRFANAARALIEQQVRRGLELAEARTILESTLADVERAHSTPRVIFAECNRFQLQDISAILKEELGLDVEPVLLADLERRIPEWLVDNRDSTIVTTGFHIHEVRAAVGANPIKIDVLITNLAPATRRQLEAVGEKGKYGFICRDRESAAVYRDLLKAELGYNQLDLTACILAETDKVRAILDTSDVILVSPKVYAEVKPISPLGKPLFHIFDRVDPMSLKLVKERILHSQA